MINDSKTQCTSEQHDIAQEELDAAYEYVLKLLESRKNVIEEYGDDDDLIRRGDAIAAIRKRCVINYSPFRTSTPEGQRALEAIDAVHKVKAAVKG